MPHVFSKLRRSRPHIQAPPPVRSSVHHIAVETGGASTAGWELLPDESGTGQPVRSRKANQDSYQIVPNFDAPNSLFVGVYDGHGAHGRAVSQLVCQCVSDVIKDGLRTLAERSGEAFRQTLPVEELRRVYGRMFHKAFIDAEHALREQARAIDHAYSGTTATSVWMEADQLFVAWAGDSRCIMGRRVNTQQPLAPDNVTAVDLTWDQKPARNDERKRVRAAGGRIARWQKDVGPMRVWLPNEWIPGLAMTRSVGDTVLSRHGVTCMPEVTVTKLSCAEAFVVAASDGVWEFMGSDEVAKFIATQRADGASAEVAAQRLVDEAVSRWKAKEAVVDDTTAVVMYFDTPDVGQGGDGGGGGGGDMAEKCEVDGNKSLMNMMFKRKTTSVELVAGRPWLLTPSGKLEWFIAQSENDARLNT